MKDILKTLEQIGINDQTIANILTADDADGVCEYCLILIAMYDDRHEYI